MDFKALASRFSFSSNLSENQSGSSSTTGSSGDHHTVQQPAQQPPTVTLVSDPPTIAAPAPAVVHSSKHSGAPYWRQFAPPPSQVSMTPTGTITAEPLPVLSPSPAAAAAAATSASDLLYHNKGALNVGQVMRYKITYTPPDEYACADAPEPLWLKIRNLEVVALRAAYLAGPFILYVDVRPDGYDQHKR